LQNNMQYLWNVTRMHEFITWYSNAYLPKFTKDCLYCLVEKRFSCF
jgi:hypothetical protein